MIFFVKGLRLREKSKRSSASLAALSSTVAWWTSFDLIRILSLHFALSWVTFSIWIFRSLILSVTNPATSPPNNDDERKTAKSNGISYKMLTSNYMVSVYLPRFPSYKEMMGIIEMVFQIYSWCLWGLFEHELGDAPLDLCPQNLHI